MSGLLALPVDAAYHLVSALAGLLAPFPGGLAAVAAIVAFTIAVRLLMLPLSYYAFRGERARSRLAPQISELYRQHAKQPERLQRELAALHQSEGTSMYAGCLPALLQVPVFSVVYRLFLSPTIEGHPNDLLARHLPGVSLGSHWLSGAGPWSGQGLVFAALFALLALAGVLSARAVRRLATPESGGPGQPAGSGRIASVIGRLAPFATVVFAAVVPFAAGLYLLTTTTWSAVERTVFRRLAQRRAARPGAGQTRNV